MSGSPCLLCGGPRSPLHLRVSDPETGEEFGIERCKVCGTAATVPAPLNLGPYYASAYHGGRHGLTARLCARRRLRRLRSLVPPGKGRRLLDVGCGDGAFLLAARDQGYDTTGTERDPGPPGRHGLRVLPGLDAAAAEAPFDAITLWHVFEHLEDPREALSAIRSLLPDGGILLLAVPNLGSLQARIFGRRWFHLDVPRHLWHYTRATLESLLAQAGFTPVRRWRHEWEYDLFGWSQSALDSLGGTPRTFFRLLTGKPVRTGPLLRLVHLAAGALLTVLAAPAALIEWTLGRGGTIVLAAAATRGGGPGPPRAGCSSP
jgi:SAM-dependent methyltransferase